MTKEVEVKEVKEVKKVKEVKDIKRSIKDIAIRRALERKQIV